MNATLYIGIILLVGLIGGKITSKIKLPSVTGYILFGLLLGPSFTNIVTKDMIKSFQLVNELALGILALSIGLELHRLVFKKYGKNLFMLSIGEISITFICVSTLCYFAGVSIELAIILGVLAMTVSPSGVFAIIKEYRASGKFTSNLLALVAIDNLLCIIIFGITMAVVQGLGDSNLSGAVLYLNLIKEITLAVFFGLISGLAITFVMKKRPSNSNFLVLLLGIVLLNTGIANHLHLSPLLLNMTTGATVVNLVNRKMLISSTLDRVELPIFVLFLTLAGAKLDLSIVKSVGTVGAAYILGRLFGKIGGNFIASQFTTLDNTIKKNMGMALTPQAGVVIGLSIIAEQRLPSSNGVITGIVLTGVIFFEIVGPLLLKKSLENAGEINTNAVKGPGTNEV